MSASTSWGYTFRGRRVLGRRGLFVGFNPAMSTKATKAVGQKIRPWHLNRRSGTDLSGLAWDINAQVRGWIGYYGAFYRSSLHPIAWRIDRTWSDGPCRSSSDCAASPGGPGTGSTLFVSASPSSSPTGT